MSSTLLEVTRLAHEEVERLERLIVKDLQNKPTSNEDCLFQSHRVRNMIDTIISTTDKLVEIYEDKDNARKDEIISISVTLSGLLNFIDGLWSSCGDERIIIFTTNHKDKQDSVLLRPGRMDVHIHMSYCTPCGYSVLAANYLGIKEDALFGEIEEVIGTTQVTPAEVAEQLTKHDEPDIVLKGLVEFLKV